MRWLWLTAFFTTFYWLHVVPVYTRSPANWLWLVIPAIVAAAMGLRKAEVEAPDARWLLLLVPLGLSLWAVPFPYNVPAILILLALLLISGARVSPGLAWTGLPLGLVGAVLAFQAAAFPLIYILSSRVHEVPALTPLFYGIVRLFHPRAGLSEQAIVINYVYDVFEFPTRLEALGFIPAALFAAAGALILALLRRPLKVLLGFLALLAGYSALRYVLLIFLTVRLKTASIFWLPLPLALSYVPLVLMLFAIPAFGGPAAQVRFRIPWPGARQMVPALLLAAAGVAFILGTFAFHDPGAPKQGRLLIDELHSDWEWTTEAYDTQWYGRRSGYNYYSLAEYLKKHFHVEVTSEPLLRDLLARADMVMLKTPTNPFSPEEIDALVEFVREGGGLWLLGDHTNVFGTSTYLNQLVRHFGLRLRYDSTYDLRTMGLSLFERPAVFAHPTAALMPPYLFATSCSMEAPYFSENMVLGYGLKAMYLDYASTSFFPDKESRDYSFGIFLQQGGVKFGKGRVVLFTDSTCFSNFFMFIPGKPELALATVEWLNRTNRYGWMNKVLFLLGAVSLAAAAYVMKGWGHAAHLILILAGGFLGFAVAVAVYDSHIRRSYPLPEPHTEFTSVAFDGEHSGFNLPTLGLTKFPETSLHTFYVWTQRLGLFPSLEPTLEDAVSEGDVVVIARPLRMLEDDEASTLLEYVEGGGRLLVIIDPEGPELPASGILNMLGVSLVGRYEPPAGEEGGEPHEHTPAERGGHEHGDELDLAAEDAAELATERGGNQDAAQDSAEAARDRPNIVTSEGGRITPASRPGWLAGGEPMLFLTDGQVVLTQVRIGKGKVFVFSDFHLLTVETMGHTGIMPNARQRSISELEYWLLRELLDMSQPELYWE